jgi:hypothetical protein
MRQYSNMLTRKVRGLARRKSPGSIGLSGSSLTRRWREPDSNYQFRVLIAISDVRKSDICDRKCAVGLHRPSLDSPKLGRAS